jgi:hypothetical protein
MSEIRQKSRFIVNEDEINGGWKNAYGYSEYYLLVLCVL